jgi:hypothetical protein
MGVVRRLAAVACTLVLGACSSGGASEPTDVVAVGPLDGLSYDLDWSTDLVGIGGGSFAFVHGLAPIRGGRTLAITVGSQGASSRRYRSPWDDAFVHLSAWWSGRELIVVGTRCPDVDVAAIEQDMADDLPLDSFCRAQLTGRAYGFDPVAERWRIVASTVPLGIDSYVALLDSRGAEAVLGTRRDGGMTFAQFRFDASDGSTDPLPPVPAGAERFCLGPHGLLAIGSAAGATRALLLASGAWTPVPLPADGPARLAVIDCDPAGGFAGWSAGTYEGSGLPRWRHVSARVLRWAPIPFAPAGRPVDIQLTGDSMVRGIAYGKFGPYDVRVYRWIGGQWVQVGRIHRSGAPDETVTSGDEIAYLADGVGRVVLVD